MKKYKNVVALCVLASALCGCSSGGGSYSNYYSSAGCHVGSGPYCTKPKAQTSMVNIQGVSGAKPVYEAQKSNGCNKDYTVLGKNYMVWRGTTSYVEEGTASWYGPGFHGKKTSNGEIYNQKGFTAAHKNLPLPSYLKVTNLRNGKKVIVRVNDRGPFVDNRIIDLSEGSARAIDMIGSGTTKVRIELLNVMPNGYIANATGTPSGSVVTPSTGSPGALTLPSATKNTTISKLPNYKNKAEAIAAVRDALYKKTNISPAEVISALKGVYIQLVACNSDKMAQEIKQSIQNRLPYNVIINNQGNINRVLVGPFTESAAKNALNTIRRKGYTDSFIKRM